MPVPSPATLPVRPRLLIVGCGDVGRRVLRLLGGRWLLRVLNRSPERAVDLRALGASPLLADLDQPQTLGRLAQVASHVLHLAPPPTEGDTDTRTRHLVQALARGAVRRLVYVSTTGVYGDCAGARFDETRPVNPATDRARRRVDAEAVLRHWGRRSGAVVTVLRVPGIYAADRPGGGPRARLQRGTPVLRREDDVYTNHIHADDLARICMAALFRGRPQRVLHASDHSELLMGDYFDLVARLAGLPPPARISRDEAAGRLTTTQLSFWSESRRLDNRRLGRELRVVLRYPTVAEGLAAGLT